MDLFNLDKQFKKIIRGGERAVKHISKKNERSIKQISKANEKALKKYVDFQILSDIRKEGILLDLPYISYQKQVAY